MSGPFVVTTKRPGHDVAKAVSCGGTGVLRVCECGMQSDMAENGGDCPYAVSYVAVATLEEAREAVGVTILAIAMTRDDPFLNGATTETIIESGGTVGPLPDGTTIQVEPGPGQQQMREDLRVWGVQMDTRDALDETIVFAWVQAFNAKQAGQ